MIKDIQVFIIIFCVTLLFGGYFLFSGIFGMRNADLDSKNYEMCTAYVQGKINEVNENQRRHTDSDGNEYYETYYIIKYEYEANGKTYKDSFETGQKKLVGEGVDVLYNSDEPFDHCLASENSSVPQNKSKHKVFICIGAVLSGLCILMLMGRILYAVRSK